METVGTPHGLTTCAGLVLVSAAIAACSSSTPAPTPDKIPGTPQAAALWGDLKPVVSVKELMKYMIDPVADNIFKAVGSTVTKDGIVDVEPKTAEDWDKIRIGAVSLAEGASLLKIRRPFTPPGDENNTGPNAVELSPAQITAKVERDPVEWNARIEALRNVALEALDVVKRKDVSELWDLGENLDKACEACHRSYWYPGEGAEFYLKLQRRLDEFREQSPRGTTSAKPQR